jgi:hypothetical protein
VAARENCRILGDASEGIHEENSAIEVRKVANLLINPMITGPGRFQF